MPEIGRAQARDAVDQEQGRVTGGVDRLADIPDPGGRSGRGLVVHHTDRLDLVGLVLGQALLDHFGRHTPPPIPWDQFRLQADPLGQLDPQGGELTGFHHQHFVAGRQGVDQCGFPGAGAGAGEDDHRLLGLEDRLDLGQRVLRERLEFRAAMIDGRPLDRAQYPTRHVGGSGDLQEMGSGEMGHGVFHPRVSFKRVSFLGF